MKERREGVRAGVFSARCTPGETGSRRQTESRTDPREQGRAFTGGIDMNVLRKSVATCLAVCMLVSTGAAQVAHVVD